MISQSEFISLVITLAEYFIFATLSALVVVLILEALGRLIFGKNK